MPVVFAMTRLTPYRIFMRSPHDTLRDHHDKLALRSSFRDEGFPVVDGCLLGGGADDRCVRFPSIYVHSGLVTLLSRCLRYFLAGPSPEALR